MQGLCQLLRITGAYAHVWFLPWCVGIAARHPNVSGSDIDSLGKALTVRQCQTVSETCHPTDLHTTSFRSPRSPQLMQVCMFTGLWYSAIACLLYSVCCPLQPVIRRCISQVQTHFCIVVFWLC